MTPEIDSNGAGRLDPVARLIAIEDIRRLKAQYWRFVDTKQWAAFGRLFAPDAHFLDHATGFECDGAAEIESKIAAVLHPAMSVHHGHHSEIDVDDESHARGIWAMYDYLRFPAGEVTPENPYAGASVHGYGHYVEQYVKLDGRWLFQTVDLYRLHLEALTPTHTPYPALFQVAEPAAV
jgi:hypothetical protein